MVEPAQTSTSTLQSIRIKITQWNCLCV